MRGTAHRWRADLALIAISFVWGATFVIVKEALKDASTLLFLALRFTLATLALAVIFRPLSSKLEPPRVVLRGGAAAGLLLFAGYALQTVGLRYTTASKSAFITGLCIVLVPVLGALFWRRAPSRAEVLGVVVATAGLALLTLPAGSLRIGRGDLLTVGCAVAFAAHVLVVGHFAPRIGFQALTLVQVAVAGVLALGTFWWAEPIQVRWSPRLVVALLITGLLATALAFSLQAWAQQSTTPTRTALILALEPVFACATSYVVEGEVLPPRGVAGAVLILAGIVIVELRSHAAPAAPPH
ncbi:MAG: DMT family transporter [Bryobacteraceae bacterium]